MTDERKPEPPESLLDAEQAVYEGYVAARYLRDNISAPIFERAERLDAVLAGLHAARRTIFQTRMDKEAARPSEPRDITGLRDAKFQQPNWDSYGAAPITEAAIAAAEALWRRFVFVPCSHGGVQLEVHTHGYDIEIGFDAKGRPDSACIEPVEAARPTPGEGEKS